MEQKVIYFPFQGGIAVQSVVGVWAREIGSGRWLEYIPTYNPAAARAMKSARVGEYNEDLRLWAVAPEDWPAMRARLDAAGICPEALPVAPEWVTRAIRVFATC